MATRIASLVAQIDAVIAESESLSPAPWSGGPAGVSDATGCPVAIGVLPSDRAAILALRNRWPELRALLADLVATPGGEPLPEQSIPRVDTHGAHCAVCDASRAEVTARDDWGNSTQGGNT